MLLPEVLGPEAAFMKDWPDGSCLVKPSLFSTTAGNAVTVPAVGAGLFKWEASTGLLVAAALTGCLPVTP